MIEVCGRTTDGRPVVHGVFRFRETYGVPLELLCLELHRRGLQIGWLELAAEMSAAGVADPRPQLLQAAEAVHQVDVVARRL
jgi:hypothetical protein